MSQSFISESSVSESNIAVNKVVSEATTSLQNTTQSHSILNYAKYFNETTCKQPPQCTAYMSKKLLTIVQNDSAEDATFTSVYCWRVLAGAQGRAWEIPAGAQRRAGTGGLMPCNVLATRYVSVGSIRFSSLCLLEMADRYVCIVEHFKPRC